MSTIFIASQSKGGSPLGGSLPPGCGGAAAAGGVAGGGGLIPRDNSSPRTCASTPKRHSCTASRAVVAMVGITSRPRSSKLVLPDPVGNKPEFRKLATSSNVSLTPLVAGGAIMSLKRRNISKGSGGGASAFVIKDCRTV